MARKKETHLGAHKYIRVKFKETGTVLYKCAFPGCTHFIRQELVVGRMTVCHACGNEFALTINRLIKKPTCGCKKKFNERRESTISNIVDNWSKVV